MRKRSRYRPIPIRCDAMAFVQAGLKPLADTKDALLTLQLKNYDALASLSLGMATRKEMDLLIEATNMAESLAWLGHGRDWKAEMRAGEVATQSACMRGLATGHFWATPDELEQMRMLMAVHDAQLQTVTIRDIEQAIAHIKEVKRNKRARKITA